MRRAYSASTWAAAGSVLLRHNLAAKRFTILGFSNQIQGSLLPNAAAAWSHCGIKLFDS